MSSEPVTGPDFSLLIDGTGVIRLTWARGSDISEEKARAAMDAVNRICAGVEHPMLVDMATTASVSRPARAVFGQKCFANAIALLGKSPVDRVIANFILGISRLPAPTKFFTDEQEALAWLAGAA